MYGNNYIVTPDGRLCVVSNEELYHHGVKGMKWGVRKALPQSDISKRYQSTKDAYRSAKKAFNKSYTKADNRRHEVFSLSKKRRAANTARWEDVAAKGQELNKAKTEYKSAKKERKNAITKTYNELEKKATLGEKLTYNSATRAKAAKYVVDNNMSVADATKKAKGDAWRNSAIMLGAYGAVTVAMLYKNR